MCDNFCLSILLKNSKKGLESVELSGTEIMQEMIIKKHLICSNLKYLAIFVPRTTLLAANYSGTLPFLVCNNLSNYFV